MEKYLGIDIGGMTVKGIIMDGNGKVLGEGDTQLMSDAETELFEHVAVKDISRFVPKSLIYCRMPER